MKRLPAFTLLEAVLSLLLVAMLGVFAFYILQSLQKGARDLGGRSVGQQELLFFSTALRADMDRAERVIEGAGNTLECHMDSGVVRYTAVTNGIIRTLANGDTALFALPVLRTEVFTLAPDMPLVQLWCITFTEQEGGGVAAYHKTYSHADRMREELHHAHQDPGRY